MLRWQRYNPRLLRLPRVPALPVPLEVTAILLLVLILLNIPYGVDSVR